MSSLLRTLERFFSQATSPGERILVAFSGGPDSTVLLWGFRQIAERFGIEVHAAHFHHGLDSDADRRAEAASELASQIGISLTIERLAADAVRPTAESPEAFARQRRYAFLARRAEDLGARYVATGHHADDQAETVVLRILFGSGISGLGAIPLKRGRLVRPLIGHRRSELQATLCDTGLRPVTDPTNFDLSVPRNAIRARLLPRLEATQPKFVEQLCRLATAARGARRRIESLLMPALGARTLRSATTGDRWGTAIDRRAFETLPEALQPAALALLHHLADAPYPAGEPARFELLRQIRSGRRIGCDCGRGWRWEGDSDTVSLVKNASSFADFTYTLDAPGSVDVPELDWRVHLKRGRVSPWMFRGRATRAGLADIDLGTSQVVVRNRRAGDRIRPLGSDGRRRLKDLLIDHRIPQRDRDRLPLLVIDKEIAWVPGITIGERFRLDGGRSVWIAEIEELATRKDNSPSSNLMTADGGLTER